MTDQIWIDRIDQAWIDRKLQLWIDRIDPIDPLDLSVPSNLGISRLAYQFVDSEKLIDFLKAFLIEYDELQISELQLLSQRYLDTAVGVQLDGIGEIVGLLRPTATLESIGAFGFEDDPTSLGFGTLLDIDIGGNFVSLDANEQLIGDNLYRLLIRAKIIENQTAMTVDDTTRLISFTFDDVAVRYMLPINLHPVYDIGKILTPFEANLLNDFPILIGIDTVEYHMHSETTPFGFDDDDEAFGFGSLTDSSVGGNFSSIVT